MERYKEEFIEFMLDCNVLKFGDFVTKAEETHHFLSMLDFTAQVRSFGSWVLIMQKRLRKNTAWTLMFYLDQRIKESH